MTQMHGQALRSKKISTRLWCFLHQCIRPLIGLLALAILDISTRASSSHGETVGQSLISRAEQCNRLAFASRTTNCAVTPEEFRTAYPQLLAWILDRYFIKRTVVGEEAIHFHELIHVIQWRLLGPEDFLAAYANGLDEFGYDNSPLEKMAYDAEALFRRSSPIFDAEKFVAEQLGRLR